MHHHWLEVMTVTNDLSKNRKEIDTRNIPNCSGAQSEALRVIRSLTNNIEQLIASQTAP